ncbi:MAG: cell envelope integrity protein TolA [Deltaproteobacteria bacterium]|nr:cell envelope integrity protein TolA [Deltaproteobacteria bacterium]
MPVTHTRSSHRTKSSHASTIMIVVALHIVMGAVILLVATTETGQKFYKEVRVKFYQPPEETAPEPEEVAKEEPPPPEPDTQPEEVPDAPVSERVEAPSGSDEVSLARSGDPFSGGPGRKIDAHRAFELAVTGALRSCFREPDGLDEEEYAPTQLSITVDDSGRIASFSLKGSSGNKDLDRAALDAIKCVKKISVARPKTMDQTLLVRFIPP